MLIQLRVDPRTAANTMLLQAAASTQAGIDANAIEQLTVRRRGIDARQRNIMVNLTVELRLKGEPPLAHELTEAIRPQPLAADAPQAIVVGAGPAGLFAALELASRGIRPVLLERGQDVDTRRKDVARIARQQAVDPESNYCFGEGGAGAFSDGKLYTRSKKRGSNDRVLQTLVAYGASPDILVDAHPHIGSNRLPQVIAAMRNAIIECGGKVLFGERVDGLAITDRDGQRVCTGVHTSSGNEYAGPVILATGHSARDVYRMLHTHGVTMEPKGLAVGVRVEHPQELIDRIFYHNPNGRGKYLPPAEYSLLTRAAAPGDPERSRAVYSFCMCPGGIIIPAASAGQELVVNGMSPANRGSRWANTGMVVEVLPDDVPDALSPDAPELKMMEWQRGIEHTFWMDAQQTQNAPAQRMTDFVARRASRDLPPSSYAPGLHPARLDKLLPRMVAERLTTGLQEFGRKHRGYLCADAAMIGCETRTSAPVRVTRTPETLEHIHLAGLYPAGEGAGYAGGIVSAAVDGIRCADALADSLSKPIGD